MRFGLALVALTAIGLAGCLRAVTIPQQEASLKEACYGKDRPMAGVSGYSVWRCGEGDQAKYAIYFNGQLVRESNELEAAQAAAGFACISRGLKLGTPEYAMCAQAVGNTALAATSNLRDQENTAADLRRRQAATALVAIGAAAAAGAAAASAAQPTYQPLPSPTPLPMPVRCNSQRLGNYVQTNCF